MREWIDLIEGLTTPSILVEKAIPTTTYGYWITSDGEIIAVPEYGHDAASKEYGLNLGRALDQGWIRVVLMRDLSAMPTEDFNIITFHIKIGALQDKALRSLMHLLRSANYDHYLLDLSGRASSSIRYAKKYDLLDMVRFTDEASVAKYTNHDWKWIDGIRGYQTNVKAPSIPEHEK